jgi:proline iminopeptidase
MMTLDRKLGIATQLADIERIRRILGQEKLILIGHSFGAFLASLYAAEFADRIDALVLAAPADLLVMPQERGGLYEEIKPLLPDTMQEAYAGYLERLFDFGSIFSKTDADLVQLNGEFVTYYRAALKATDLPVPPEQKMTDNGGWMVHAMYFSMGRRHDYRDGLREVGARALVLHGELDLQPEAASRSYSETLPNATFRVVRQAGHFLFHDQPREVATAIGEFLKTGG